MIRKTKLLSNFILLTILTLSAFTPTLAFAAPLANSEKDWQYTTGNSWGWNYSPETQINQSTISNLEVKWIFPLAGKATADPGMGFIQSLSGSEGSTTPPIVHNGMVYVTTNYLRTYAVDAGTGKQQWVYNYVVNITDVERRLPVQLGPRVHLHGFRYWESGDALLLNGLACDFYGIDAKTGQNKLWVQDLCLNIPGNIYSYYKYAGFEAATSTTNIATYEKGRQFIFVLPGSVHATVIDGDSRHVTEGISMDPPYNVIWRTFEYPPQDVPTKDWALQECDIGYFQTHPCSDVAAKNRAGLEWDWASPGNNPSPYGGVTANWGVPVVDEDTGILYTQTGNQGPFFNMSLTPGPRLYGSTIMAINMDTGKRIWWLQPFPRDPYDYDCNWSGVLADVPQLGKVYAKGCKEGILYVMDALTGKPLYTKDVMNEMVSWGQVGSSALKVMPDGVKYFRPDPYSYHDMREYSWIAYPATKPGETGEHCSYPCTLMPNALNGLFGTDTSYDPQTGTLFHYANAVMWNILRENPYVVGQSLASSSVPQAQNSTIVARDLATGEVKWTWFYSFGVQRSALLITPDLLFTGFTDGYIRFFDKNEGTLLREMNLGSDIVTGLSTAQDSDGNQMIFVMAGTGGANAIVPGLPGTLVAIGLSERTAASASTSTVTTTSVKTTSTTVTSETTQTVTQTTGLPAEITYAIAAVAVIAIIAAAFLVMRKK